MREIKFRAWDKENNKMHKVNLIDFNTGFINLKGYVELDDYDEAVHGKYLKDLVLMQYTGLKDKNRKENYESDVVTDGEQQGIVEYYLGGAAFTIRVSEHKRISIIYQDIANPDLEVIGNLYENPELLK